MSLFARTVEKERKFEKKHILKLKESYLHSDVIEKAANDEGYCSKLEQIEQYLDNESGWILDIGSNTCGEAEYLATKGYSIVCSDINEYALDISKERTIKYGRNYLNYVACDGHRLPFKDNSFNFVTLIESLHHMVDPQQTLLEARRVLVPGGKLFLYEPYAYDPYRRISEVRDYFKGTIEKSFSISQLTRWLEEVQLTPIVFKRHVAIPSSTKMARVSSFRRALKKLYYKVSVLMPEVFGMVVALAEKPDVDGAPKENFKDKEFVELLQCPITGSSLRKITEGYENDAPDKKCRFKDLNGIPILIPSENILDGPE